jgi:hypothetical protein
MDEEEMKKKKMVRFASCIIPFAALELMDL